MKTTKIDAPIHQKSLKARIWDYRDIYFLLLPTVLFYIIFHYVPMLGAVMAFQNFKITKGIFGSEFVGFQNFIDFLSNYKFWVLLRNTLTINVTGLIFTFPMPIILALLLNEIKSVRFKKSVQTITYLPHFISMVVICSLVLDFVSSEGLINSVRGVFGFAPISFMTKPKYFVPIYVISDIWQRIGWDSIIYIAALSSIDMQLYEAADIDGAGRWQKLWHVTLPGILGTIVTLLVMRIGHMLSIGYEKIMLLYNPSIYETADVISTYVYRQGLLEADYSYSTAVGLFNSVFNFILLMSANTISKKLAGSGLW